MNQYQYRHQYQEPYQYQTAERLLELLEVFYWKGDIYRKQQFIHLTVRGVDYVLEVMENAVDISKGAKGGIPVTGAFSSDIAKLAMEILKVVEADSKREARKRS